MEPGFWHDRWVRAEIGFHKQEINVHLQQFWNCLELHPGERVFVPLCGKSLDLLWLAGEARRLDKPLQLVRLSAAARELLTLLGLLLLLPIKDEDDGRDES